MPGRRSAHTLATLVLIAVLTAACVQRVPAARPIPQQELTEQLVLNEHALTLHLVRGGSAGLPLLVYATGDGGWRGKDREIFRTLVAWGYPVAGFSAPEYVKHLGGEKETTTPRRLADDYASIIDAARRRLELPASTRFVMVGVSRGAGLAVVAAGQRALRNELGGVVAIGLTQEEEHVRWFRRVPDAALRTRVMLDLYEYLPTLGPVPISVIQSTRDNYLPSQAAHALFGPDTERRRFNEIESRNHSFSDARPALYDALHRSLDWLNVLMGGNATTP